MHFCSVQSKHSPKLNYIMDADSSSSRSSDCESGDSDELYLNCDEDFVQNVGNSAWLYEPYASSCDTDMDISGSSEEISADDLAIEERLTTTNW